MRKVVEGIKVLANSVQRNCKTLLYNGLCILNISMPYICLFAGAWLYRSRGGFVIGPEWGLPMVCWIVKWIIEYTNMVGNDRLHGFPVARKRFTKRDKWGMVEFKSSDMFEMAEYMCELEEYCEKFGKYQNGGKVK